VLNNTAGSDVGINDSTNTLSLQHSAKDSEYLSNVQYNVKSNVNAFTNVNVVGVNLGNQGIPQIQDAAIAVNQNNIYANSMVNQSSNSIVGMDAASGDINLENYQTAGSSQVAATLGIAGTSSILGFQNIATQSSSTATIGLSVNSNSESVTAIGNSAINSLSKSLSANAAGTSSLLNNQTQYNPTPSNITAIAQSLNIGIVPGSADPANVGGTNIDNHTAVSIVGNTVKVNALANVSTNNLTQSQDSTDVSGNNLSLSNSQLSGGRISATANQINVGVVFNGSMQDSYANTAVNNNNVGSVATANFSTNSIALNSSNAIGSNSQNATTVSIESTQISGSGVTAAVTASQLGILLASTSASGASNTAANVSNVVSGNAMSALATVNSVSNNLTTSTTNALNNNVVMSVTANQTSISSVAASISNVTLGVTAGFSNQSLTALNQIGVALNSNTLSTQAVANSANNVLRAGLPASDSSSSMAINNNQNNTGVASATTSGVVVGFNSTNTTIPTAAVSTLPITVSGNTISTQAVGNIASNSFIRK